MSKEKRDLNYTSKRLARFLFESMMLKRTLRTGYAFLGKGKESVAAHTFGVAIAGYVLGIMHEGEVDMERLLLLCLFHDLPEARTGDANAVHKKYVKIDEESAIRDLVAGLPDKAKVETLLSEWRSARTIEAQLARDADQLDMLISLKEKMDLGSSDARTWIPYVKKRLKTPCAKRLADAILGEHWAAWWLENFIEEASNDFDEQD